MVGVAVIIGGLVSNGTHSHLVEIIGLVYVVVVGAIAWGHVRAVPRKLETDKGRAK